MAINVVIGKFMNSVLQDLSRFVQPGNSTFHVDHLTAARKAVEKECAEKRQELNKIKTAVEYLNGVANRLKVKKKENLIVAALNDQRDKFEQASNELQDAVESLDEAIKILKDYTYKFERNTSDAREMFFSWNNVTTGTTT